MSSLMPTEEIKQALADVKAKFNLVEPDRGNLDDETIVWRHGKPDYTKANYEFFKGKKMNHAPGSLHKIVEDLVKTWEMEASHKAIYAQWTTIDHDNYVVQANGGRVYSGEAAKAVGNYNWLLEGCPKELYNSDGETFDSSHDLFRGCFADGFPFEVVEVYSGPPKVAFSWRHWGIFNGPYRNNQQPTGETVELYGFGVVKVNEQLKIQTIDIYYKPNEFLEVLEGKRPDRDIKNGTALTGPSCPFLHAED